MRITFIGIFIVSLLSACGPSPPSNEERRSQDHLKRQEAIQQARMELDQFAQANDAKSVDFVGTFEQEDRFTASLQQKVEGQVVAFRATLLDVQRTPNGDYDAVFGYEFFSATIIRLSISSELAGEMMRSPDKFAGEALVAARIDRISRNLLKAQACSEPDCSTVSIEVDWMFRNYQASGRLIELSY